MVRKRIKKLKKPKFMTIFLIIAILAIIVFLVGASEIFKEPIVEETTTTIETTVKTTTTKEITTTIEEVTTTTDETNTTVPEVDCDHTRFDIKSYTHINEVLKIYFRNKGSEHIYGFGVKLYYPDKVTEITYSDEDVEPNRVKTYTMDVGVGLDNVTVYILGCPFDETSKYGYWQYWINV